MKNLITLFTILIFSFLMSCSDTIVKEQVPDSRLDTPAITGYFKKRGLIEDYTGTWCSFCARVAFRIDYVPTIKDKAVVVSILGGNPNSNLYITLNALVLFNYFFPVLPRVHIQKKD